MAEKHQIADRITGRTLILASLAGVIIGGPLLAFMSLSFLATMTLLLVTSPLLILFSPLLFGAAFVFGLAMIGFATSGAMAVVGVSMVGRILSGIGDKLIGSGGDISDQGKDWAGFLQQKAYNNAQENMLNRG